MQPDWSENWRVCKRDGGSNGAERNNRDALLLGASEQSDLEMLLEELAELIEAEGGILIP